jgi:predicted nucleic acid-binding protein
MTPAEIEDLSPFFEDRWMFGKRKAELLVWLDADLPELFSGRVLPMTQAIAERWGVLEGQRQLMGRPLNVPDPQIAATALEHDLTVVTRNMKDFEDLGVKILNPLKTAEYTQGIFYGDVCLPRRPHSHRRTSSACECTGSARSHKAASSDYRPSKAVSDLGA